MEESITIMTAPQEPFSRVLLDLAQTIQIIATWGNHQDIGEKLIQILEKEVDLTVSTQDDYIAEYKRSKIKGDNIKELKPTKKEK